MTKPVMQSQTGGKMPDQFGGVKPPDWTGPRVPSLQGPRNGGINPNGMYSGGRWPTSSGGYDGLLAKAVKKDQPAAAAAATPSSVPSTPGATSPSAVNVGGHTSGGINPGGMYSGGASELQPPPAKKAGFLGEAQGASAQGAKAAQAASGSAADQYINKDTDTVEGRMVGLLSGDNEYRKLNETQALQAANARGTLNSSMAVQAGRAAAIGSMLPIAQQDASTYSGFATRSQQYDQQQGLNADQFAQERAIKQWEQDNLAYSQLIKGISDINMQDMSKTAKDQAIKNLWEMYQKARPISSSLSNVSIVDGKIVRGSGGSASGGGAGTNSGGSAGAGSGGGGGTAGGSGAGANAATQKSYFDFKSTKEMPQWVRDSYKARYGNIEPPKAQAIEGVIQYANEKFKKYLSPVKTARVGDREVQYSPGSYGGATFSSFDAAKAYKEFITKELKKAGLPTDEKTLSTVAAGPDWKAPPSTYMTLGAGAG